MIVDSHIPHDVLLRFLQNAASKEEVRWITRHLLSGCERCHGLTQQIVGNLEGSGKLPVEPANYSPALQAVMAHILTLEKRRQREVIDAPSLWAKLRDLPPQRREMYIRTSPRFATWGLFDYLLSEAWIARLTDPKQAIEVAELALSMTDYFSDEECGENLRLTLKAEAYTALGNYYRIIEDFNVAMAHLDFAEECLEMGTGDDILEGRMLSIRGSLLRDIGDLEESAKAVTASIRLFRSVDEPQLESHGWIKLSTVLRYTNPLQGVQAAEHGLQTIEAGNRELITFGNLSKIDCMVECGYGLAALAEFQRNRGLLYDVPGRKHRANVKFLTGRIAASVGEQKEAVRLLVESIRDYREQELYQEMSMAQLRLVWLLMERGDWRKALQLAEEAIQQLERLGLRRHVLAVWVTVRDLLARRALEDQTARRAIEMVYRYWKVGIPESARLT